MIEKENLIFRIGDKVIINQGKRQIFKDNVEIILPELSYRLLLCLATQAPNVVSQQYLLEHVWQGKIVSDDTIKKRVSRIREALEIGEGFIVAERGLGYRLATSVETIRPPLGDLQPESYQVQTKQWSKRPLFSALIVSSLILSFIYVMGFDEPDPVIEQTHNASTHSFDVSSYMKLINKQRLLAATESLNIQLEKTPGDIAILSTLSETYHRLYLLHEAEQHNLSAARQNAETAVKLHPEQPWGFVALAETLISERELYQAIDNADKAIALANTWIDSFVVKARALRYLGNTNEAWQTISIAYHLQPEATNMLIEHSHILTAKNMFSRSENQLMMVLKKDTNNIFAQLALAELYLATERYDEAQSLLIAIAKRYPSTPQVKFYLALSYDLQGNAQAAVEYYGLVAASNSRYRDVATLLVALFQGNDRLTELSESTEFAADDFSHALSYLVIKNEDGFIAALSRAIENKFATEYYLKSSIIENALTQSDTIKQFADIKEQLYHLNQNKRLKRVPVISK